MRDQLKTASEVSAKSRDLDVKLALIKDLHELGRGREEREDEQLYGRSYGAGREDSDARS